MKKLLILFLIIPQITLAIEPVNLYICEKPSIKDINISKEACKGDKICIKKVIQEKCKPIKN